MNWQQAWLRTHWSLLRLVLRSGFVMSPPGRRESLVSTCIKIPYLKIFSVCSHDLHLVQSFFYNTYLAYDICRFRGGVHVEGVQE